ncbi:Phr family secreted Rap phosphatase inhibitor [Bacillus cereus]|nr:Phr family secreted Rap phosphatase inhibitor [Bacillus cereus]MDF9504989.1 Phr family secreted Rap phosphatase inhibitor [Bacillus cereus]MDF9597750.1 Phr family secreted Rap phosphatase inhibitor [Bacillus cereus]MDF9609897.1 Phr family secreted Rap phosphatase inhibitor [Bacillus cereus]MDF9660883.1 Phr family secreted Rap phosphatase inhibitor [Bacillus cereus]MEB9441020.1 Phr family secreted Rap phosphatase inhibitor [Bacillus cereus]
MKKVKLGVLSLLSVVILSIGLNTSIQKENASEKIQSVIAVQYEHGRGI